MHLPQTRSGSAASALVVSVPAPAETLALTHLLPHAVRYCPLQAAALAAALPAELPALLPCRQQALVSSSMLTVLVEQGSWTCKWPTALRQPQLRMPSTLCHHSHE